MKTFDYAGKTWEYDHLTVFLFELGRYENTYKVHKEFGEWIVSDDSPLGVAVSTYENFHVSDGYKKRLSMVNKGEKTIIAREGSKRKTK
jgi:hypothetical protein